MKHIFFIILVVFTFSLPDLVRAVTYIDQAGRKVDVPVSPQRVVSLAPSITEIVYSLERQDMLVGATQYSNHPEAAKELPRVGSYVRLDLEKIVALKPDLCLGIRDGNPEYTVKKIEALGIPVYVIDPRNLRDIIDVVDRLGRVLGARRKAAELIRTMQARMAAIRVKVESIPERPRVFFQIDAAPIITVGKDTFIHELITLAGGINVAGGQEPYPRYNWEQILMLQPEIAIVASMAGGHSPEELKSGWLKWPQIPAVKKGRIHVVDANLIDRPTPRLIDGLEEFTRIIHPEFFND